MRPKQSQDETPVPIASEPPIGPQERFAALSEQLAKVSIWAILLLLLSVVLTFGVIRLITDVPLLISGKPAPLKSFEARYVANPVAAYLHIIPGIAYLIGAMFQLSRGFRERHWRLHRRMGPFVLGTGLLSGLFAVGFGVPQAYGGMGQAAATAVFGAWFLAALCFGFAAIRRGEAMAHRKWMIRAFAVGLGVGSIRIWIGLLESANVMTFQAAFAPAFWLGLGTHALAAELWLRWRPSPTYRLTKSKSHVAK